jgi:hypothetical protein
MAAYTKHKLSEDLTGAGFALADGVPVTIHTTPLSFSILDELWIYAANKSFSNPGILQLVWQDISTFVQIPALSGMFLVVPGLILSGDGTDGSSVDVTDMTGEFEESLSVHGFVNRITP